MSDLSTRLSDLLAQKNLSMNAFAKMIGVSQRAIAKIVNGETRNPKNIIDIASALGVSAEWLKTGKGNQPQGVPVVAIESDVDHAHRIDMLDAEAHAGEDGFINADYPEIVQSIWLSDLGVSQILGRKSANGISIIKVPTDSMMPTISPRDLVFIDTNVNAFTTDGIYVFKLNGKSFIKRLQMLPSGVLQATSDNTNYLPFEITEEQFDTAEIIGKFVSVVSINPRDL